MTKTEREREWHVAYETALGRMCDDREPTERQKQIARIEADEWVKKCAAEEAPRQTPTSPISIRLTS